MNDEVLILVMTQLEFAREVREVVKSIPEGKVLTYGDVAALAGRPSHARQVGQILGNIGMNSDVPCHRVVNSLGKTAPHWHAQQPLLESEGVTFSKTSHVNMKLHHWSILSE